MVEAEIDRSLVYVTNAVKHFKLEPRGKRRIHQKPNSIRKWALLILHASFIEIKTQADSPEWDSILGSIWDAAGVP
jgi:hypothetical protein